MTIFLAYSHALSCFPATKATATRMSSRTWSTLRMRNIWNFLKIRSFPKPKVVCRVMMLMLEPPCVDCNKGNLYKTRDRVAGRSMRLSTFGFQLVTNSYIIWFDGSPDSTTTWSSDLGFQLSSGPQKKLHKQKMPSKVTGATNVNQIAEVFILLLASIGLTTWLAKLSRKLPRTQIRNSNFKHQT